MRTSPLFSQADALSEESWQDQVLSPHEPHDEPDEEGGVPGGYFQRRWHGKQSIKRQIREFLITGWCKWRGRRAEHRAELARAFDQQFIRTVERRVQERKQYCTKRSRNNTEIGATTQLKYALEKTLDQRMAKDYRDAWNEDGQTQSP